MQETQFLLKFLMALKASAAILANGLHLPLLIRRLLQAVKIKVNKKTSEKRYI
jgi:hypothetical protein